MDKNKNGLVESSEAITGRWSLRGSIPCKLSFIQECDEDTSGSVSRQEWLNCFKIQGECQVTCILRWQIERQCFDPRGRGGGEGYSLTVSCTGSYFWYSDIKRGIIFTSFSRTGYNISNVFRRFQQ